MKTKSIFSTVLFFLILLVFLSQSVLLNMAPAFGATNNASVRRALLIGIGKYEVLPHLPGAKNDIDLVHQVLVSRYGFSEKNVREVRNEAATREGILSALNQIVKETGPNDVVYIHYSGHGSQVEDLNGDEPEDQLDETIVPQDGRMDGVPDITDDELEDLLSNLKTPQAVVVLDSCHSGTATRGLEVRVRSVPADTRLGLYKKGGITTRALVPTTMHSYMLFSGAASHEAALDGPVDGRYHGFFTHSLFKSLQMVPPGASTREVFAGAKDELKRIQIQFGRTSMPEPQLEAPASRLDLPLFAEVERNVSQDNQSETTRRSWAAVRLQQDDQLVLVNAVTLGAAPGSVWGLFPDGETLFDPEKTVAFAIVNTVEGPNAMATMPPKSTKLSGTARAILIAPAPQSHRLPVRLRNVSPDQAKLLKRILQHKLGDIEFVGTNQFARFLVEAKEHTWQVYSADGGKELISLPMSENRKAHETMAQVMRQSRNASQLLALENPATQINLNVRVMQVAQRGIAVVSDQVGPRGIAVVKDRMAAPVYHIRQVGEQRSPSNSLQLEVISDTDCFITIVDVDAEGNVNVLFPNAYQNSQFYPDGFIRAKRSVLLPDSLNSGNRAGFHWDYTNPPGVDTIRVFASTDKQLTHRIRRSVGFSGQQGSDKGEILGNPLAQLVSLRQELIGSMTRGLITVPEEPIDGSPDYESAPAPSRELPTKASTESEQELEFDPDQAKMSNAMDLVQATLVQNQVADWTAASVTVLVQP